MQPNLSNLSHQTLRAEATILPLRPPTWEVRWHAVLRLDTENAEQVCADIAGLQS